MAELGFVLVVIAIIGLVLYLAIFGPVGEGYGGSEDRDLSPWGNPDRDRVPGSRRRH
ncbi:MAG: hypothetical protein ACRDJJ_09295 [Actinomycetota bacterium]